MKTTLAYFFYCLLLCLMASCSKEKTSFCNNEAFTEIVKNDSLPQNPFQLFGPEIKDSIIYFSYTDQENVRFTIGKTIMNVCPEERVLIRFNTKTTNLDQTKSIRLIARVIWSTDSPLSSHVYLHSPDPLFPDQVHENSFEVDVSDIIEVQPAEIEMSISIEFARLDSFEEDSTYFVNHIESFEIEAKGKLYE